MLSTDGKWKLIPRLHSVKFVFDDPIPADAKTPEEIVFENPFPADIPGVHQRFVFKAATAHAVGQDATGLQTSTTHGGDGLDTGVSNATQASDTPEKTRGSITSHDSRTKIASGEPQRESFSHIRGPTCDSPDGVESIVCAAWALILSSLHDSEVVNFGVCVTSSGNPDPVYSVTSVTASIDPQSSVAAFLQQVKDKFLLPETSSQRVQAMYEGGGGSFVNTLVNFSTTVEHLQQRADVSIFALQLHCVAEGQDLQLHATFDERSISGPRVRLLLSDLEQVIWQLANSTGEQTVLADVQIMSPTSQRHLVKLNRPLPTREEKVVQESIAQYARTTPHAEAICAWDGSLSYSELHRSSEILATYLAGLGVGPEEVVPIIFEKSVYSIISILGVVMAGGAVVVLDPSLPAARISMIVKDVDANVVVSSVLSKSKIPSQVQHEKRVVVNQSLFDHLSTKRQFPSKQISPSPTNALYVVYTSGSTGKPKGVVVTHEAFCSSAKGYSKAIRLNSTCRVLQYSSFSFDISMLEVFTTLMAGSCLCIPSEEDRMNNLASCISSMKVNWAMLTPTVASLMTPEEVPSLEVLCLVGEALPQAVADAWADDVKTINAYGPAECSAITIVSEPRSRGVKSISLGRPANCAVWIVREDDQLASFGAVGEIVIEGPPVARGYLGDQEKTNAVFLDDPNFLRGVVRRPMRCYRTGDLGKMNHDGTIDFLGRKDTQVKINGQRVELGEIEHQLGQNLNSEEKQSSPETKWELAVEFLRPMGGEQGILTAFVAPKITPETSSNGAGQHLIEKVHPLWTTIHQKFQAASTELAHSLPGYMIPRAVVPCYMLLLSPSGKVDRKTLRTHGNAMTAQQLLRSPSDVEIKTAPTEVPGALSAEFPDSEEESSVGQHTLLSDAYPSTEASMPLSETSLPSLTLIEKSLRLAWSEVLGLPEDSILLEDDFFKLGGDSIGAIRIVAACRKQSLQINVANIFKNSVLGKMALVCKSTASENQVVSPVQIVPFQFLRQEDIPELQEEAAFQCDVTIDGIEDLYPCTHMQEGLMAVNLTRPGSYTGRWIHPLPRNVNLSRFRQCWEDIHAASSILRTRFATTSTAGSLQAVIRENVQWLLHDDLEAYLEQDDANPMFPGDSLNRFALVTSESGDGTFVWTIHHMLYDGWSLAILCDRLNDSYHGRAIKPATDYRNFIAYTQRLTSNTFADYWKTELQGVHPSSFPATPKPGHQSFARAVVRDELNIHIDPSSGITMSTIVRAAWSLMIGDLSKSDDVLFGATVSGRNAPLDNIESIEGPTIATVPVRVRIDRGSDILDFLRKIQDHATAMIPYEQSGIQQIKSLNQDTKSACEFQNLLVIQAGGGWDETGPGPLRKPIYREEFTTFPVTCEAWIHPDRIEFATHVDEDVTSRLFVAQAIETVKGIMSQLAWATSHSYSPSKVADLALEPSSVHIQDQSSQTFEAKKLSATLHQLITGMSLSQPQRDAVVSTADSLSYETLEKMSSALAVHLIDTGVLEGDKIPLCFEKSVWTVVAMLGVLKAGASFVPLDPGQPVSRLRKVIAQVKAKTVLMSAFQHKATDLGAIASMIIDRDALKRFSKLQHQLRPPSRLNSDSAAYVIFTSGSTGDPKGIVVSHTAFASSAMAHGPVFGMNNEHRVLQFSAYSFDASLFEILTTLIHGGTVCVATEKERFENLGDFASHTGVNLALLTPSVARIIRPAEMPSLKTLVLGGEAPDEILIKKWLDAGVTLFNAYGPSECSVIAACHPCTYDADPKTIGFSVGCSGWVVTSDDDTILVPDGEVGELLVGGPTLADGYLDDYTKTHAAFLSRQSWVSRKNPSGTGRLYKTGDLVKRTTDGTLVYVGRKDLQVKLNGQRIELGDIESHISVCDLVKRSIVVFPSSGPFAHQLVAVLELEEDVGRRPAGLQRIISRFNIVADKVRQELAGKLPSIMLPAHFVDVATLSTERFPLSSSGKVDRKQVTAWLQRLSVRESEILDTSAPIPSTVATIQSHELPAYELAQKITDLVSHRTHSSAPRLDGFNDVLLHTSGLDSLNTMSLMHFIRLKYNVRVSMQLLMDEHTSIRSLAAFITCAASKRPVTLTSSTVNSETRKLDLMAEIDRLDAELQRLPGILPRDIQGSLTRETDNLRVFLTGASGYLGTQILRQLLERRDVACVTTLVRGATPQAAKSRVIEAAQKALWWTEFHDEKLDVWMGDLAKPELGLGQEQWDLLGDGHTYDVIVHNGAVVHWNKSYAALEAVNIHSTVQLLGIAVQNPALRFVYVSGGRQWKNAEERDEDVARELSDSMGYSQTKFVAEVLAKRAAERCPIDQRNIGVFRPGLIIGTPAEGVANMDDYIWRLTAANINMGIYNADEEQAWLHLSDAATTSVAVIRTAFNPEPSGNPVAQHEEGMTWGAFWTLVKGMGYDICPTRAAEWLSTVRNDISRRKEKHPLWPLAHLLEDGSMEWEETANGHDNCPLHLKVAVKKNMEALVIFRNLRLGSSRDHRLPEAHNLICTTMEGLITIKAQCMCKAHTFSASLAKSELPLNASCCHCTSCRRLTGSLYNPAVAWPNASEDLSALRKYAFSQHLDVYSCSTCSSQLFARGHNLSIAPYVTTGALENLPELVKYDIHMFIGDTIDGGLAPWLPKEEDGRPVQRWIGHRNSEEVPFDWPVSKSTPASRLTASPSPSSTPFHCHCKGVQLSLRSAADLEVDPAKESTSTCVDPKTLKFKACCDSCNSCRQHFGSDIIAWTFAPLTHINFRSEPESASSQFPQTIIELKEAVLSKTKDLRFGTLAVYNSSPEVERYSCSVCSASIFYAVYGREDMVDIAVGLLNHPDGARAEALLAWNYGLLGWAMDAAGGWREQLVATTKDSMKEWAQSMNENQSIVD
ncbi:amino acid adenylation domain-containing protein [Colletotrichum phormii]|uniref:Amino acid adenylation domain-containing protein n=1 Tax=Colletotrichum phormii TaxID=359342 RepID=A0AAJ0E8E6_9PEZI|nr:amino acid adenylation domain-containing protein [Colletotrichum phormii]KAK1622516.1 amino acid adenylation domain-containing protein [Colletotrichum phormii]